MEKLQTNCKKCGSDKVRLIDHEQLFIPYIDRYNTSSLSEHEVKELYQWDEQIFGTAQCDNCGNKWTVEGTINWNV